MCGGSSILAKTKKLVLCGKSGVGGCRCCGVVDVEEVAVDVGVGGPDLSPPGITRDNPGYNFSCFHLFFFGFGLRAHPRPDACHCGTVLVVVAMATSSMS
jgi:hypothetical protein